jgi:isoleucyl-tRNA synthetase
MPSPLLRRLAGAAPSLLHPFRPKLRTAIPERATLRCLASKGGKVKAKDEGPYSKTVNLPQTSFDMRANSVVREPQLQAFWQENGIYESLSRDNPGDLFTLHDGPPYANGDLHIGHALNKILKDFINRYQLLQGRRARFVPGWDCHGLPIELKVLQSMKESERRDLTPLGLRRKAADFALRTVDAQREQFKRYGVWADWEDPYVTLRPRYEAAQLRVFGQMVLNGHIYRGRKPVHWSPSSRTALAEAELEYPEGHTSRSIYVAMPIQEISPNATEATKAALQGAALAIWTTTPWTIPANLAVAVNGELDYAVVAVMRQQTSEGADGEQPQGAAWTSEKLVVGSDLITALEDKFGAALKIVSTMKGSELEGCTYRHPLYDRCSPVVIGGDYITTDSGTGLVHTAPGHGQEDYLVGQRYGLPLLSPVDDAGRFTDEAGPFAGLAVQTDGNQAVIEALQAAGALLKEEKYAHKYPYDWRTKKPTIFRATDQWFASVEGFRGEALEAIRNVAWYPAAGEKRITAMTEGRSDWCISRQRKWGVPIPVFYDVETGDPLLTEESIEHVARIIETRGSDAWWELSIEELLPEPLRHLAATLRRGEDTMDVWFDSGSSWAGVLSSCDDGSLQYPADLYLEGSDQHRGWFQSSLLTSVAASGRAPYRAVLTHGFVLDEKGAKMSKSIGNVVDPRTVIEGGKDAKKEPPYGADVLRLWVASVDYSSDVMIGGKIIGQVADVYRKVRFTLRFLLGNLSDYDPTSNAAPYESLSSADRYILSRFAVLLDECKAAYDSFQFYRVYQALQRFVVLDLSNFYLDVAKDRLYIRDPASPERRACQTVLDALLRGMLPLIAPLLPHMAEDAWQNLPYGKPSVSVFQAGWMPTPSSWRSLDEREVAAWKAVLGIRSEVNQQLERARADKALGSSLEAKVSIHVEAPDVRAMLQTLQASDNGQDALRYALIVSQAALVDSAAEAAAAEYSSTVEVEGVDGKVTVGVGRAEGRKCGRCWNYSDRVGSDAEHPELCERCLPVIKAAGVPSPVVAAAPVR